MCSQGSGSNVDLCVITKEGTKYLRPYEEANQKGVRQGSYRYKRGTTGTIAYIVHYDLQMLHFRTVIASVEKTDF